jgi:hypothetical protein
LAMRPPPLVGLFLPLSGREAIVERVFRILPDKGTTGTIGTIDRSIGAGRGVLGAVASKHDRGDFRWAYPKSLYL